MRVIVELSQVLAADAIEVGIATALRSGLLKLAEDLSPAWQGARRFRP